MYMSSSTIGHVIHEPNIVKFLDDSEDCNWKNVYDAIYKYLPDTYLREFKFKFVHNILINNSKLCQWKIKTVGTCDLYQDEVVETIGHQFWACNFNQIFLEQFKIFCLDNFSVNVTKDALFVGVYGKLLFHINCLS